MVTAMATAQSVMTADEFAALPDPHGYPTELIKGNLVIRHVLGGHTGMMQEPHVGELARELTDCLKK